MRQKGAKNKRNKKIFKRVYHYYYYYYYYHHHHYYYYYYYSCFSTFSYKRKQKMEKTNTNIDKNSEYKNQTLNKNKKISKKNNGNFF